MILLSLSSSLRSSSNLTCSTIFSMRWFIREESMSLSKQSTYITKRGRVRIFFWGGEEEGGAEQE